LDGSHFGQVAEEAVLLFSLPAAGPEGQPLSHFRNLKRFP
jgi:hypothetical protein